MKKILEAACVLLDLVVDKTSRELPCLQQRDGKPCTKQHEGSGTDGKRKLYFMPGCKVVESFCPVCSAYWHAAVARNQLEAAHSIALERAL